MTNKFFPKFVQGLHLVANKKSEKIKFISENVKKTILENGTKIITLENCSPISKFGAFIGAGARYETSENLGITHILRNCAGLSTKNFTIFGITRNIDYLGGDFKASTTRDNMIYSLQNNRDKNSDLIKYFLETIFNPIFHHWEIKDNLYRVKVDLERCKIDPLNLVFEGLHKVSFKDGLSNSLYCPDYNVESFKQQHLFDYMLKNYLSNNSTFVGIGVDHDEFLKVIKKKNIFKTGSISNVQKPKFLGGNERINFDSDLVFTAVASEGVSLSNRKEVNILKLVSILLGNEIKVPYSLGGGLLSNVLSKHAKEPFKVFSFNINYTDTGLFGFTIISSPKEIHQLILNSINAIKETFKNFNKKDLENIKNRLLADTLIKIEDQNFLLNYLGNEGQFIKDIGNDVFEKKIIDSITVEDVQTLIQKLFKNKCTISSVGKLNNVPYVEDLF